MVPHQGGGLGAGEDSQMGLPSCEPETSWLALPHYEPRGLHGMLLPGAGLTLEVRGQGWAAAVAVACPGQLMGGTEGHGHPSST